ncbi:MAG TPA: hypothetical protein DCZ41_00445 [Firmicutes bacterium]|nr:hypothetical protein [Bacillota bacterium]
MASCFYLINAFSIRESISATCALMFCLFEKLHLSMTKRIEKDSNKKRNCYFKNSKITNKKPPLLKF